MIAPRLRVAQEFVEFHSRARPSQGSKRSYRVDAIPDPHPELLERPPAGGKLIALPVLGGVQHEHRLIAFRHPGDGGDFMVVASFANCPEASGYRISPLRLPDADWREIFNSDAARYGGDNMGNLGGTLASWEGAFTAINKGCSSGAHCSSPSAGSGDAGHEHL